MTALRVSLKNLALRSLRHLEVAYRDMPDKSTDSACYTSIFDSILMLLCFQYTAT